LAKTDIASVCRAVPIHVKRKRPGDEGVSVESIGTDVEAVSVLDSNILPFMITIQPRIEGLLYSVDHYRIDSTIDGSDDLFVILSNNNSSSNFKLSITKVVNPSALNWADVLAHSQSLYIEDIDIHSTYWAISGREGGYENVWLALTKDFDTSNIHGIDLPLHKIPASDSVYVLTFGQNYEVRIFIFPP